jgi:hypothetical protein
MKKEMEVSLWGHGEIEEGQLGHGGGQLALRDREGVLLPSLCQVLWQGVLSCQRRFCGAKVSIY